MKEIIAVVDDVQLDHTYLILECGHWYKWTGTYQETPRVGELFPCPYDSKIEVKYGK
jgi:hypothetical protein